MFHIIFPYSQSDIIKKINEFFAVIFCIVYCNEPRSRGISYMKYVKGRRNGLVTFCLETAFYNGLLKESYKGG
jgi:hypothetical protein